MAEKDNKIIEGLSKQNVTESKSIKESQIKSEEVLSTNLPGLRESSQKHRNEDEARFQRQKRRERIRFAINTVRYFKDKLEERKARKLSKKRFLFENKQRLFIADKQQKNIDATILVAKSVNDLGTQMAGNDLLNEERRREQNALFSKLLNKDEKDRPELRKGLLDGLGKGLLIAAALTGILAATGNLETAVQGWVQGGINFAKNVTKKLVERLSAFKEGAKGLGKTFRKAFRGVTRSFRRGMNSAVSGITKRLTGALGSLKSGIDDVVSGLKSKVGSVTKTLTEKLAKSGIGTAAKKAGGFFSKVAGGAKALGAKAVGGVKAAGAKVASGAKGLATKATEKLGSPVTKFIKSSAPKILKFLGRVPILGSVIEGIFANKDIKAVLTNPDLSDKEKEKAVGERLLEAIGGPAGAAAGVALLNLATGGAGFMGSFVAAAGGDFAGRFIARQMAKFLPVGLLGKAAINTIYGGLPEEAEGGGTSIGGIAKGAVSAVGGTAQSVGSAVSSAVGGTTQSVGSAVGGIAKGAVSAVGGTAQSVGSAIGATATGFTKDQQSVLGSLKDALADADTEEKRLEIAAAFRKFKLQEADMGTEGLFSDEFKAEQSRLFAASRNNTGAQMEAGMSNISEQRSRPAPVVVSGGGGGAGPQNTTVNSSNVVVSNSKHIEESFALTTGGYAIG